MIEAPSPSTRLVVVGKTGTGKSYRVKATLREWLKRGVRVVAVDVADEYSREGQPRNGLACDGPLRRRVTALELAKSPELIKDTRLSLSVVPNDVYSPRSMARTFLMVEKLLRLAKRPAVLVADEVGQWTNSSADKLCHQARVTLEALATTGRKDGFALVTVSQSAAHIPSNVRRQSDEWWAFLQDDPTDLEAMIERMGKEKADEVSRLGRFQFVTWRDATHNNKPALRAIHNEEEKAS